jgi:hypothetical protein
MFSFSRLVGSTPAIALVCLLTACGPFQKPQQLDQSSRSTADVPPSNSQQSPPSAGAQPSIPPVAASPAQDPQTTVMKVAPLWEKARALDGKSWTNFAAALILAEGSNMLKGTADMTNFCPSYSSLDTADKLNVWVYLISAVTKYESGFNPTSRMKENLGTDAVTHSQVYSEGLLQLSYQDSLGYKFCNEFDWNADKNLGAKDPRKTILDPYKNLRCGIRILNKIVGKHNLIAFNSGHYWSTLMPKNSSERSIQSLVHSISICR